MIKIKFLWEVRTSAVSSRTAATTLQMHSIPRVGEAVIIADDPPRTVKSVHHCVENGGIHSAIVWLSCP
jgi:hypothetical protein